MVALTDPAHRGKWTLSVQLWGLNLTAVVKEGVQLQRVRWMWWLSAEVQSLLVCHLSSPFCLRVCGSEV
jgi:hypothetical protein